MFNQLHKNITVPGAEISPLEYGLKAQHRDGLLVMEIENLVKWVPYNEYIGDPDCTDTHLVEVIEEWKDIPDYLDIYQISSFGRVKSLSRNLLYKNGKIHKYHQQIKKNFVDRDGYLMVKLWKNQKSVNLQIHRLVGICFLSNENKLPQINHKDTNKKNPLIFNLEWCTGQENSIHAVNNGCIKTGVKNNYVLNLKKAKDIREDFKHTTNKTFLAKKYNVSRKTISNVLNNLIYKT